MSRETAAQRATRLALEDRFAVRALAAHSLHFYTRYLFARRKSFKWRDNWHHKVMCQALQDVFDGKIKRLIINCPPRYSKSEIAVLNFITWAMGRAPDSEFIHVSYSATLAENNSAMAQHIMAHEGYREVFPDVRMASNARAHWKTTAGGVMYATGSGGSVTGFGAGKMRPGFGGCFPYGELVSTDRGPLAIGDIVTHGLPVRALSVDLATGARQFQVIDTLYTNPSNDIVRVHLSDGTSFDCTPNHEIHTRNRGWVQARDLLPVDALPLFAPNALDIAPRNANARGGVTGGNSAVADDAPLDVIKSCAEILFRHWMAFARVFDLMQCQACLFGYFNARNRTIQHDSQLGFGQFGLPIPRRIGQMLGDGAPRLSHFDLAHDATAKAIARGQNGGWLIAGVDGDDLRARELGAGAALQQGECAVPLRVGDIVGLGAVAQIAQPIMGRHAIEVTHFDAPGLGTDEGMHDKLMHGSFVHLGVDGEAGEQIPAAPIQFEFEHVAVAVAHTPLVTDLIVGKTDDRFPVFIEKIGHVDATYCLEVRGNHNFILAGSGALVSNCIVIDDPHKANEAGSDTMRNSVIEWYQNTLASRCNNPDTPIILIMQRLHETDLAGWLLGGGSGEAWTQVCLPAIDEDTDTPLWEWKFSLDALRQMEKASPYVFAGQYMQRPAPLGGGIFKTSWWRWYGAAATPAFRRVVQSWDTAFKTKEANDYSVCTTWGETDTGWYLIDIWKDKVEFPDLKRMVVELALRFAPHAVLVEDKASGQSLIQELRNQTRLPVIAIAPTKDKVARANLVTPLIEAGRVHLPEGVPEAALLAHSCAQFPNGAHDDDVDSVTQALAWLSLPTSMVLMGMAGT